MAAFPGFSPSGQTRAREADCGKSFLCDLLTHIPHQIYLLVNKFRSDYSFPNGSLGSESISCKLCAGEAAFYSENLAPRVRSTCYAKAAMYTSVVVSSNPESA